MAISETFNETAICNMSLAKLGANKTLVNVETGASQEARECRLHYEQTRDALLRSHSWRFAAERAELTATTTPAFEWGNAFTLPTDFLAMRSIYENRFSGKNVRSYALEGQILLTNEADMEIRYTKKVTDVTEFDSLFIEVLVLQLALKLVSLAGASPKIRALDGQETNTAGRFESSTWNDARYSGREGFPMRF